MSIFAYKERDGTVNLRVVGYLTKDPKVTEKVVLFSVCYGKKKYMDCKAWAGETAGQTAACMEHHDNVDVSGVFQQYTNRDGVVKDQLLADAVIPLTVPTFSDAEEMGEADLPPSTSTYKELTDEVDEELPF